MFPNTLEPTGTGDSAPLSTPATTEIAMLPVTVLCIASVAFWGLRSVDDDLFTVGAEIADDPRVPFQNRLIGEDAAAEAGKVAGDDA